MEVGVVNSDLLMMSMRELSKLKCAKDTQGRGGEYPVTWTTNNIHAVKE